jgi:hypothetical protein
MRHCDPRSRADVGHVARLERPVPAEAPHGVRGTVVRKGGFEDGQAREVGKGARLRDEEVQAEKQVQMRVQTRERASAEPRLTAERVPLAEVEIGDESSEGGSEGRR